jgi:uncharacterized protein with HEPN domain
MFEKDMAYSLVCMIKENLETILKRTINLQSPGEFVSSEQGMILLDSICMKLVAIGESIKNLDKITNTKNINTEYTEEARRTRSRFFPVPSVFNLCDLCD